MKAVSAFFLPFLLALPLLYGSEAWLATHKFNKQDQVSALTSQGVRAAPAITAQFFLANQADAALVPLGGLSHAQTILCRESSGIIRYQSDRYGFNNPDALWDQKVWDIALLGDSFAQGFCVKPQDHFATRLRQHFPQTANLGSFGNGPLAILGSFLEFATDHHPKTVIWTYVANDLGIDLPLEEQSPKLRAYLEGKTQGLAHRQTQVDQDIARFLTAEAQTQAMSKFPWRDFLLLQNIHQKILLWLEGKQGAPPSHAAFVPDYLRHYVLNIPRLGQALGVANQRIKSWHGRLIFLILPDAQMFVKENHREALIWRQKLHAEAARQGAEVADFYDVLSREPNPFLYFAPLGGYYGHYNEAGYAKLAAFVEGLKN